MNKDEGLDITLSYFPNSLANVKEENLMEKLSDKYISWSSYDRISLETINNLSEFFNKEITEREGKNARCLHLMQISDSNSWIFNEDEYLIKIPGEPDKQFDFLTLITFTVSTLKENEFQIEDFLNNLSKELESSSLKKKLNQFQYAVYSSLGIDDGVIVLVSNSIQDNYAFIAVLKKALSSIENGTSKVRAFINANHKNIDRISDAGLRIRLHFKSSIDIENNSLVQAALTEVKDNFKGEIDYLFSGEKTVEITVPKGIDVFSLYNENGENNYFNLKSSLRVVIVESK